MGGFTADQRKKAAETRARNVAEKRARQAAAGIPDSKPFGGTVADDNPILNLHVGGVLVSKMLSALTDSMAAIVLSGLTYSQTDEGIASNNEGKVEGAARVTQSPVQKQIQQRGDQLRTTNMQPWEAGDPLRQVSEEHIAPGMKGKFLSPTVIKKRGMRGYQPVMQGGEPVKVGELILGQMPTQQVDARNAHYRAQGAAMLAQINRKSAEQGLVADK